MRKFEKIKKKKFRFEKNTDTEIGPWLRFPIQKPGFGRTLLKGSKKLTINTVHFMLLLWKVPWQCWQQNLRYQNKLYAQDWTEPMARPISARLETCSSTTVKGS